MESKYKTSYEFFDAVLEGELGEHDINNYIAEKANYPETSKLKSLLNDIEYCLFCEKEETEGNLTESEIQEAIEHLKKSNQEIPYKLIKEMKAKDGRIMLPEAKILNLESLLFPYKFHLIYRLIGKLKSKIKEIQDLYDEKDRKFEKLNIQFKSKFDIDIPFGSNIFESVKEESSKIADTEARIYFLKNSLFFWIEASLSDPLTIGESEVTKRLIPLLENHIKSIELNNYSPVMDENTANKLKKLRNNFDGVDMQVVFNHFSEGLVKKNLLLESELVEYIQYAFDLQIKPKNLFKFKNSRTKSTIGATFYNYYKDIAGKPHGKQKDYAALLGEYFTGFKTSTVSTNFNKY